MVLLRDKMLFFITLLHLKKSYKNLILKQHDTINKLLVYFLLKI